MSCCGAGEAGCSQWMLLLLGSSASASKCMRIPVEVHLLKLELCLAHSLTGPTSSSLHFPVLSAHNAASATAAWTPLCCLHSSACDATMVAHPRGMVLSYCL